MRKLGPAWTKRGRKPAGHLTRDDALVALHEELERARVPRPEVRAIETTFSEAADEWLRYVEHDRKRRYSTVRDYKIVVNVHLRPEFGEEPIAAITTERIERYRRRLVAERKLSDRSITSSSSPCTGSSSGRSARTASSGIRPHGRTASRPPPSASSSSTRRRRSGRSCVRPGASRTAPSS